MVESIMSLDYNGVPYWTHIWTDHRGWVTRTLVNRNPNP